MFIQNNDLSGFQKGAYYLEAIQPTQNNWSRQSTYESIENPVLTAFIQLEELTVHSSPILGDEDLFLLGGLQGGLYAIKLGKGLIWRTQLEGMLGIPVLSSENQIIIGSTNNYLYALNVSGALEWIFKTEGPIKFSSAISSDSVIFFVSDDGHLYAINRFGNLLWKIELDDAYFWSSPCISCEGIIYVGCNNELYAVDSYGKGQWEVQVGSSSNSSPIITKDGTVYIEGSLKGVSKLFSISRDGLIQWMLEPDRGHFCTSPSLDRKGNLFIGCDTFRLYSISIDGKRNWDVEVKGTMYDPPLITHDGVVYACSNKTIRGKSFSWIDAIRPDGSLKWSCKLNGFANSPVIGKEGKIIIATNDFDKKTTTIFIIQEK